MAIQKRTTKDGTTRFTVAVAVLDPVTGTKKRTSVGTFTRKRDAEAAERAAKVAIENGTFEATPSAATPLTTVRDAVEVWYATKAHAVRPNTATTYRSAIVNHVLPAFGDVPVKALTHDAVQRQVNRWQDEGMGARMVHLCMMVLRASLARQVKNGTIAINPADGIEKPSARTRKEFTVWTEAEADRFLTVARTDRMAPLWYFTLMEGMRQGEALGLRWSDLQWNADETHCVARITQTLVPDLAHGGRALIQPRAKTQGSQRAVQLMPSTIDVLKAHRDRQRFERQRLGEDWAAGDLIIATTIGTPVTPSSVKRSLKALMKRAGVPDKVTTHGLRHMAATVLLKEGVSPALVAQKLGHTNIGTTVDLYGHLTVSDQDAVNAAREAVAARGRSAIG